MLSSSSSQLQVSSYLLQQCINLHSALLQLCAKFTQKESEVFYFMVTLKGLDLLLSLLKPNHLKSTVSTTLTRAITQQLKQQTTAPTPVNAVSTPTTAPTAALKSKLEEFAADATPVGLQDSILTNLLKNT